MVVTRADFFKATFRFGNMLNVFESDFKTGNTVGVAGNVALKVVSFTISHEKLYSSLLTAQLVYVYTLFYLISFTLYPPPLYFFFQQKFPRNAPSTRSEREPLAKASGAGNEKLLGKNYQNV